MLKSSKGLRRERRQSKQRGKFWAALGRITLKLLVVAPLLTKVVELAFIIIRIFRQ
jgi:hypothetical protein